MSSEYFTESIMGASVTVEMPDGLDKLFDSLSEDLIPTIKVIIGDFIDDIYNNAKKNWLVRARKSKNSKDKFEKEIFVSEDGQKVKGIIRNNAPYAYMIYIGKKSRTEDGSSWANFAGNRIWDLLVVTPMEEGAPKIQEKITESIEIMQQEIPF